MDDEAAAADDGGGGNGSGSGGGEGGGMGEIDALLLGAAAAQLDSSASLGREWVAVDAPKFDAQGSGPSDADSPPLAAASDNEELAAALITQSAPASPVARLVEEGEAGRQRRGRPRPLGALTAADKLRRRRARKAEISREIRQRKKQHLQRLEARVAQLEQQLHSAQAANAVSDARGEAVSQSSLVAQHAYATRSDAQLGVGAQTRLAEALQRDTPALLAPSSAEKLALWALEQPDAFLQGHSLGAHVAGALALADDQKLALSRLRSRVAAVRASMQRAREELTQALATACDSMRERRDLFRAARRVLSVAAAAAARRVG
jgi:hypothetical protein